MYWLVGAAAIVVVLAAVAGRYLLRIRSELREMSPLATGKVVTDVFTIRDGHVNLYLIADGDRYVAIDSGQHEKVVEQGLSELGIDKKKVAAVLLTHTDRDHVRAVGVFEGATIYVPEGEEVLLDGTTHRIFVFNNKVPRPYLRLAGDSEMNFGNLTVRTFPTPGHTPGSTCYLVNGTLLFTGDTISLRHGSAGTFSTFFNMDTPAQAKSLKAIAGLTGVKYIFTAHHGFSDNYEAAFEKWKK